MVRRISYVSYYVQMANSKTSLNKVYPLSVHCVCLGYYIYMYIHVHRMQALKEPVYTQREAEMAAGMGNYVLQQPDANFTDIDMTECSNKDLRPAEMNSGTRMMS